MPLVPRSTHAARRCRRGRAFVVVSMVALVSAGWGCRPSTPPEGYVIPQRGCDSTGGRTSGVKASFPTVTPSEGLGAITGVAVDGDSLDALRGTQIRLRGPVERTVASDENGGFAFEGIPVGAYIISARHLNYRFDSTSVTVAANSVSRVTISMRYYRCP